MHAGGPAQRQQREDLVMSGARAAAAMVAGLLLAAGGMAASAPAATADSISVTPVSALLYTFTGVTVSGIVTEPIGSANDGFVTVSFNRVAIGTGQEDLDTGVFSSFFPVPPPADGESGGAAVPVNCGTNTVSVSTETDGGTSIFVGSATVSLSCAAISVSPDLVGNQQLPAAFSVTPRNFPAPGGFTLTVDGAPQAFTTAS